MKELLKPGRFEHTHRNLSSGIQMQKVPKIYNIKQSLNHPLRWKHGKNAVGVHCTLCEKNLKDRAELTSHISYHEIE